MEPIDFRRLNKPRCTNCAKYGGCKYVEQTDTPCLSHVHRAIKPCTCGNAEIRLFEESTALTPDGVFVAACDKCGKLLKTGIGFTDCILKWNKANELRRA